MRRRSLPRRITLVLLWIVLIPFAMVLLVLLALQTSAARKFISEKAVSYLASSTGAKVSVASVEFDMSGRLSLTKLTVKDKKSDPILYCASMNAGIDFGRLLRKEILVNAVELNGLDAVISRKGKDTAFNYQFIADAFLPEEKEPSSSPKTENGWDFSLREIRLENVRLEYLDEGAGLAMNVNVGNLHTTISKSGFATNQLSVSDLKLKDVAVSYESFVRLLPEQEDTAAMPIWEINVDNLSLENISFNYKDVENAMRMKLASGKVLLRNGKVNTGKETVDAQSLAIVNTSYSLVFGKVVATTDAIKNVNEPDDESGWVTKVNDLTLSNCAFNYDDDNSARVELGADYSHLFIQKLQLHAETVRASQTEVSLRLKQLSFNEKGGFGLSTMQGEFFYSETSSSVKNLKLMTHVSNVSGDLSVSYPSISNISRNPGSLGFNVELRDSEIGIPDLLYFSPAVAGGNFNLSAEKSFNVDAVVRGTIDKIDVSDLYLQCAGVRLKTRGRLTDLMKPDSLFVEIPQLQIEAANHRIEGLITQKLPVSIPRSFTVETRMRGYLRNMDADLALVSSSGAASASLKMDPDKGPAQAAYDLRAETDNLDVGGLVGSNMIGAITSSLQITGRGMDTASIDADLSLYVSAIRLHKYNYRDLSFKGHLLKSSFTGHADAKDPNLAFSFDGYLNADATRPAGNFTLDLQGAALKELQLTEEDRRVSARVESALTFPSGWLDPLGNLSVTRLLMLQNGRRYYVDSVVLNSTRAGENSKVTLASQVIDAGAEGIFSIRYLGYSIARQLNSYFAFGPAAADTIPDQQVKLFVELKDPSLLLSGLVPSLELLLPFRLEAEHNSRMRQMHANLKLPQVKYSGVQVDSFQLGMNGDERSLKFSSALAALSAGSSRMENFSTIAEFASNHATFNVSVSKDDSSKVFAVAGNAHSFWPAYEIKLLPDLTLASAAWKIDSANLIGINRWGFYFWTFNLSDGRQRIGINSTEGHAGAPILMKFGNFDLATITSILRSDSLLAAGIVNGDVLLETDRKNPAFRSDIRISNLSVLSAPLGELVLKADNIEESGRYVVEMELKGYENDLSLSGSYLPAREKENLDLKLQVKNLQLATAQPFVKHQASGLTGAVQGKVDIRGSLTAPELHGRLSLKDVAFKPRLLSIPLRIPGGEIILSGSSLNIPGLVFLDSLDNKATLSGAINISKPSDPRFDLKIKTTQFLALNTKKTDNPLYYGRIFLDCDAAIKGTLDKPDLNIRTKINKGSSLTYVKPESQVMRDESRGIVEFRDTLAAARKIMQRKDTSAMAGVSGIALNAVINIDREVDFRMIVDPLSGDSLFLRGGGLLNFVLEPSGHTGLTGKYTIHDGGYYLTLSDFIKRNFRIQEGSSVTWSGDPLDAYADINAIYITKASPIDLMSDQLGGLTEPEKNKFRNLLTFHVFLKMRGFISSPDISFDIQLAPEDRGALSGAVNTKLGELRQEENQLNKQVFALLTLRRFVSENPLESENQGGLESTSRNSASQILTTQLNTFADRYVNFVDLDLGVSSYEDYSSGQQQGRTQVQVGVSKQMFNDRVTVRVGGNVDVEGQKAKENNANEVAGNISIDYKLTEDGRYKLKAFRENQYENPIEGELTKTGAGVVFTRDFNKFRNMFKKPRNREYGAVKAK
jgi:translocation and assembly module TamB